MKKEIINAVMKRADLGPMFSPPDESSVVVVVVVVVVVSHPTLRFVFGHLPSSYDNDAI